MVDTVDELVDGVWVVVVVDVEGVVLIVVAVDVVVSSVEVVDVVVEVVV